VTLYTQAGNLIAGSGSTSDQGSLFASAGTVQPAFGSSIAVVAGTNYYASLWINSVTTAPTLARASSSGVDNFGLASGIPALQAARPANGSVRRRTHGRPLCP
jgi:hypothetical protein